MARSATVPVDSISVGKRHRKDMGDLQPLAGSIDAVGLLHPIGITPDKELIFGERRLRAVRGVLGWDRIEAEVFNLSSIVAGEDAENRNRKDFTVSERVEVGRALEKAMPERRGGDTSTGEQRKPENLPECKGKETRQVAAERAGFGNETTYGQAAKVVDKGAPELVTAMDKGLAPSVAAKVAELPKAEQKKAAKQDLAGNKAAFHARYGPPGGEFDPRTGFWRDDCNRPGFPVESPDVQQQPLPCPGVRLQSGPGCGVLQKGNFPWVQHF